LNYTILYRPGVDREMAKLPRPVLRRVDMAILGLGSNPRPHSCKKLTGQGNLYRVRVGDWRIVYEVSDSRREVEIQIVANRKDVYRRL
jgi:mRNA interferase RelE/StbE